MYLLGPTRQRQRKTQTHRERERERRREGALCREGYLKGAVNFRQRIHSFCGTMPQCRN